MTSIVQWAEPDLKVVIGSDGDQTVEYYYSRDMAKHSKYIYAMMTSPMREATTKEIHFPDIPPCTWRLMVSVLEEPLRARTCTVQEVMKCMPFYHKYDFPSGLDLSETVIKQFLKDDSNEVSKILDVIRFIQDHDVESLKPIAIAALKKNLVFLAVEDFKHFAPLISMEDFANFLRIAKNPSCLNVFGAGLDAVNGTYIADGYLEGANRYVREVTIGGVKHRIHVFLCTVSDDTKHWYMSSVPAHENPGTTSDTDFYTSPVATNTLRNPPISGWRVASEGKGPIPQIKYNTQHLVDA